MEFAYSFKSVCISKVRWSIMKDVVHFDLWELTLNATPASFEVRSFLRKLGKKAAYSSCNDKVGDYLGLGS